MFGKIIYAGLLCLTVYLNIMYDWKIGVVVLSGEIILLFLGLVWSALAGKKLEALCEPEKTVVMRGENVRVFIKLKNNSRFPVADCRVEVHYRYFMDQKRERLRFRKEMDAKETVQKELLIQPEYCGKLEVSIKKIRVSDFLGLWSFSRRDKKKTELVILPKLSQIPVVVSEKTRMFPIDSEVHDRYHSGDDVSEVFDMRKYRPGDRLQRVHWKMSARENELIVKEYSRPEGAAVVLFIEGDAALKSQREKSAYFEKIFSVSYSLLEASCVHYAVWMEADGERLWRMRICSEESFYDFVAALFSVDLKKLKRGIEEIYKEWFRSEVYSTAVTLEADAKAWTELIV